MCWSSCSADGQSGAEMALHEARCLSYLYCSLFPAHSIIHPLTHSLACSLASSSARSLTHSLTHSLARSLARSLAHACIHSLSLTRLMPCTSHLASKPSCSMQSFEGCILLNCATGNIAIAAGHVLGRSSTSLLQHYLMFSVVRQTMGALS